MRLLAWIQLRLGLRYRCRCGALVYPRDRQGHELVHTAIRERMTPPTVEEVDAARLASWQAHTRQAEQALGVEAPAQEPETPKGLDDENRSGTQARDQVTDPVLREAGLVLASGGRVSSEQIVGFTSCWKDYGIAGRCRMPEGHEGDCAPVPAAPSPSDVEQAKARLHGSINAEVNKWKPGIERQAAIDALIASVRQEQAAEIERLVGALAEAQKEVIFFRDLAEARKAALSVPPLDVLARPDVQQAREAVLNTGAAYAFAAAATTAMTRGKADEKWAWFKESLDAYGALVLQQAQKGPAHE